MDGFKRPKKMQPPQQDLNPGIRPPVRPAVPTELPPIVPPQDDLGDRQLASKKRRVPKVGWIIGGGLALLVMGAVAAGVYLLAPKDASASEAIPVEIVSGMLPGQIADKLEESGVIRSSFAFGLYTRLSGVQNSLQAGSYQLSPADSVPEVAAQLQEGPVSEEIEVMFTPGATLADSKDVLVGLGYSESEINAAFSARYDHPLLQDRPAGSDLEGYIFGETHRFVKGTPVKDILERYFDDYYAVIKENDLINKFKKQGLTLHEGIILASIIQREVQSEADQRQVAQVFFLRLESGMSLGADSTFEYAAKKEGVAPSPELDSPYNTRKHTGLPPGPIATPGVSALIAAANPADGDYMYFVSGDDGVNHFSRTLEEHEAKVRQYCTTLCFGQ